MPLNFEAIGRFILLILPRFYNRITWLIVSTGLLLMSSPIWERVISALLQRDLNIQITPGDNDAIWGFALVFLGLIYHLLTHYLSEHANSSRSLEKSRNIQAHDENIFRASLNLLNETQLENFLSWLSDDHSFLSKKTSRIDRLCDYLSRPESQYLTPELSEAARKFVTALESLRSYISLNFFVFQNRQFGDDHRLCLKPWLNVDREWRGEPKNPMPEYDAAAKELSALISIARGAYANYRKAVKGNLYI